MLVGIANYEKGNTFTHNFAGATLTNPVHTDDAYGLGGGAVYKIDLSAIGPKSYLELFALAGFGASNFSTSTDVGDVTGFSSNFLVKNPATPAGVVILGRRSKKCAPIERADYLSGIRTRVSLWDSGGSGTRTPAGFRLEESFVNPRFPVKADGVTPNLVFKNAAATRNLYTVGIRPIVWIADNIAIERSGRLELCR